MHIEKIKKTMSDFMRRLWHVKAVIETNDSCVYISAAGHVLLYRIQEVTQVTSKDHTDF